MERITEIIPRRGINDDGKGKKYALRKLITAANTEYIWLRDDDTHIPSGEQSFIPSILASAPSLVILPLRMTNGNDSLLERLQQTEYAAIQSLTMLAAERGHTVMCSGANLIAKRNDWLECANDLHEDILSGDDMFLLESMKRRRKRITYSAHPIAEIHPQPTLKDLLRQRPLWIRQRCLYLQYRKDIRQG